MGGGGRSTKTTIWESYNGRYLRGKYKDRPLVVKLFRDEHIHCAEEHLRAHKDIFDKTVEIVDRWNKKLWTKKIWVNETGLKEGVKISGKGNRNLVEVERWIPNFVKYNSNSGWVSQQESYGTWEDVAQALSHFSYHTSNRSVLLCDVQGGATIQDPVALPENMAQHSNGFFLTDPAIHSQQPNRYGATDLGPEGIAAFFSSHQCNEFCERNWLWPKSREFDGYDMVMPSRRTSWTFENLQSRPVPPTIYTPAFAAIAEEDPCYTSSSSDDYYW